MDSYEIFIVRDRDLSKEFRFTNGEVIELVKNYKGKNFNVTIRAKNLDADSSAAKNYGFTSSSRKIINKTSARKILTEANNELLDSFDLDKYKILRHEIDFFR